MPWLPKHSFSPWPEDAVNLSQSKVMQMYDAGFAGCRRDENAIAEFYNTFRTPNAEDVAHASGIADNGAGKLVCPFIFILEAYPGGAPGAAQERGDCVSHNEKNASLMTMCCDVAAGLPDEKTGKVEGFPEVPAEGIKQGVLSTETFYWWRGYNGDGWMCHAAAVVATGKSGFFLRMNYPDLGVDLTRYSGGLAGKYGASKPPDAILKAGQQHLLYDMTEASTFEAIRDFLFNGYGVSSCGGEGYQNKRDQYGCSKQSGSWAHAMAIWAVDDRDIIKQIFGQPLVLIMNSWNIWNSGPRDIYQSASLVPAEKKQEWVSKGIVNASTGNIMIPEGSFWTPWSHCKNREYIVHSGGNGFPKKSLPNLGTFIWG